jgi:hypothetical protein
MLAGPNSIRTKDSIVCLSNKSPITNVVLNRIVSLHNQALKTKLNIYIIAKPKTSVLIC